MQIKHRAAATAATLGVLLAGAGGGVALAGSANASSTVVTASTSVTNHPDTTSGGSGTACTPSSGGPVWAKDAYTSQMTAVNTGTGTWDVTLQDTGNFAGFADPANCNALVTSGNLLGLYTVKVTSTGTPSQANLAATYSGAVSTTTMVQDFFKDSSAKVTGGDYFFSYEGGQYVQTTSSIYGDVTPAPPTMVKVPNVVGQRANPALSAIKAAGLVGVTSPLRNPHFTYVVTGESPKAGASVAKGSKVTLLVKRV